MSNKYVTMITGAAGLIGSALARAIVANKGKVALVDIDEAKGLALASEFDNDQGLFINADITIPDETDRAIKETLKHFNRLDSAVHCAYPKSTGWDSKFENLGPEYLTMDLQRQLGGAILFSQRIIAQFIQQGHGNLIHISSIQGIATPKFDHYENTQMTSPIEYTAIKSGIIAITRWLAKYYKNKNIRVNCISPGGIFAEQPESFLEKYSASCCSKGMLDPDDLIGSLLFLLSDSSKYMNGQNIVVDDGWSL